MKFPYFIIHPGKNSPPQNGYRLKSVLFLKSTGFTSSTFPIEPDFSQNQPAAITLNTGSPRTLLVMASQLAKHLHVQIPTMFSTMALNIMNIMALEQ
jgi:hypothetical protein